MADRADVLTRIATRILTMRSSTPLLVGIDGTSGSGKTIFAAALADALQARGRQIIVASIDDVHFSPALRSRKGKTSPSGFYEDSYDHGRLRQQLLDPLRGPAPASVRLKAFDHRVDAPVESPPLTAADAILCLRACSCFGRT